MDRFFKGYGCFLMFALVELDLSDFLEILKILETFVSRPVLVHQAVASLRNLEKICDGMPKELHAVQQRLALETRLDPVSIRTIVVADEEADHLLQCFRGHVKSFRENPELYRETWGQDENILINEGGPIRKRRRLLKL